ncbi:bcl-2-binding component 3 [Platysternon megacephalum]|uniref:Bcl-2-binding component 3 n=1 Tax=Platysternon megacephalum TaxID=55544 RepID=A0A4D9E036_9SAUR|nr:bcl-2-binding component 3 [Platysternon megacephalum]
MGPCAEVLLWSGRRKDRIAASLWANWMGTVPSDMIMKLTMGILYRKSDTFSEATHFLSVPAAGNCWMSESSADRSRNDMAHWEGNLAAEAFLAVAVACKILFTDHEELCGTSYGPFCLNGGICYMIPTVSSPFCRKAHIRRASSTERGASLVETASSNGCNSEYI